MTTPRTTTIALWGYAAFGAIAVVASLVFGDAVREALAILGALVIAPAVVIGRRSGSLPSSLLAGVGIVAGFYVLLPIVPLVTSGTAETMLSGAIDVVGNLAIITLLVVCIKRRRGRLDVGDLLDGAIIAIGSWLVAWILLVNPMLSGDENADFEVVLDASYLPMSVPIIALVMMFLFSGRLDRASNWLIATALIANVLGDITYALNDVRGIGDWALAAADLAYLICFAALGAALVHPSAAEIFAEGYARRRIGLSRRTVGLVVSLVIPVSVLAIVPATSTSDTVVRTISALLLLGLTGYRLHQATDDSITNQQRLLDAARTDDLTGLPNKGAVLEIATDSMDHAWRSDRCPSMFLFDLDRFKNINDSLGHRSGDDVIMVIAERLELAAKALGATVGRPAGDEFVVFDPTPTSEHQALNHAEVLHSVFKQPLTTSEGIVFVTASVGVAAMPAGRPISGEELFRRSDIAMYRAKDSGRNCLALYNDSMQERISERMRVETELHGAIERRELRLFHQPIVELSSGRVSGFEALIRWQKPDGTMVSPAEFVPIAEDTGLISELGSWALLEALTQLREWTDDGVIPGSTTVSVNVSPRQLAEPGFPDTVEEALRRAGVDAHRLWIEITESVMVENPEVTRTSLRRVRAMGVRVALDDFGTGYSSLSLLQQFPIQRIKIDRAFVNGVADSSNDRSLVRTVIGLGESMGLDIVAEGVETVEQLRLLRSFNCAKAQGFLISHPVPPEAVRSTVAALESLSMWPEFAEVVGADPLPAPVARRL